MGYLGKVVVSMSVWAVSCLEQWFKVHKDLLQENTSPNSSRLTLFIYQIQLLLIEYKQSGLYTLVAKMLLARAITKINTIS